jgi:hypothetical protein
MLRVASTVVGEGNSADRQDGGAALVPGMLDEWSWGSDVFGVSRFGLPGQARSGGLVRLAVIILRGR